MTRPRLLDLMCGAGGATRGYQQAGFHVTGVDIKPQPNYVGDEFHQGDALEYPLDGFDAVHASPPCQRYAPVTRWRGYADDHPDLLWPTIDHIDRADMPWVVENVPNAPFHPDLILCGTAFGLPFRRHRWFMAPWIRLSWPLIAPCRHQTADHSFDHGGKQPESAYRDAIGCHWMTVQESREAIPPAYTRWIGERLLAALEQAA